MHREVSMHESRPEKQQTIIRVKRVSNCYRYIPKKNLRVFDYVAAAVLAADVDAAVLIATMTPPYVRQKRLLAG